MTIDISTGIAAPLATTPQALWALGDYALMAEEVMAPLGPVLVASTGITEGDRVLDVAAGSGIFRSRPPRWVPMSFPATSHRNCWPGLRSGLLQKA